MEGVKERGEKTWMAELKELSFLEAGNRRGGVGDRVANDFTFVRFAEATNIPRQNDETGSILIHGRQLTTFSATPSSSRMCNPGRRCRRGLN
jgi:hypothetical protein